jgi:hypothetical protein
LPDANRHVDELNVSFLAGTQAIRAEFHKHGLAMMRPDNEII